MSHIFRRDVTVHPFFSRCSTQTISSPTFSAISMPELDENSFGSAEDIFPTASTKEYSLVPQPLLYLDALDKNKLILDRALFTNQSRQLATVCSIDHTHNPYGTPVTVLTLDTIDNLLATPTTVETISLATPDIIESEDSISLELSEYTQVGVFLYNTQLKQVLLAPNVSVDVKNRIAPGDAILLPTQTINSIPQVFNYSPDKKFGAEIFAVPAQLRSYLNKYFSPDKVLICNPELSPYCTPNVPVGPTYLIIENKFCPINQVYILTPSDFTLVVDQDSDRWQLVCTRPQMQLRIQLREPRTDEEKLFNRLSQN